jgi:hypothetical protein
VHGAQPWSCLRLAGGRPASSLAIATSRVPHGGPRVQRRVTVGPAAQCRSGVCSAESQRGVQRRVTAGRAAQCRSGACSAGSQRGMQCCVAAGRVPPSCGGACSAGVQRTSPPVPPPGTQAVRARQRRISGEAGLAQRETLKHTVRPLWHHASADEQRWAGRLASSTDAAWSMVTPAVMRGATSASAPSHHPRPRCPARREGETRGPQQQLNQQRGMRSVAHSCPPPPAPPFPVCARLPHPCACR